MSARGYLLGFVGGAAGSRGRDGVEDGSFSGTARARRSPRLYPPPSPRVERAPPPDVPIRQDRPDSGRAPGPVLAGAKPPPPVARWNG
ncbi:MAG: hypothetical protein AVDCRST_MAG73-193 [uncultured Thermomicrobiales bacterium]|uniref:Uncharacterized protein n=1 Tax=uncultured Thermomicrobiales bacterium TaxID=1645740 RepID=A0A6J4TEK4_9BACT|nr:MAG: hypothetical protein AVDCRST_MAG73-193 [uncultured Thermomicrobiales bacterium]